MAQLTCNRWLLPYSCKTHSIFLVVFNKMYLSVVPRTKRQIQSTTNKTCVPSVFSFSLCGNLQTLLGSPREHTSIQFRDQEGFFFIRANKTCFIRVFGRISLGVFVDIRFSVFFYLITYTAAI